MWILQIVSQQCFSLSFIASSYLKTTEWTTLCPAPSLTWNLRVSFPSSQFQSTTYISSTDVPPQYTIASWHMHLDEACEALTEMQHTHCVNYLKAYNIHGKLLWPCHYCKYLQEVLVQIHFTMKHWSIGGKRRLPVVLTLLTSSWCVYLYLPQLQALWCQRNGSFFKKTLSCLISAQRNSRLLLLWLK